MAAVLIRRGSRDTDTHTDREDHVTTQREDSHLPAKGRGLRRNQF